jgi:hypothetical protein
LRSRSDFNSFVYFNHEWVYRFIFDPARRQRVTGSNSGGEKIPSADDNNTWASTGTPDEQFILLFKNNML